jgi:cell division septation protein DedD
MNKTTVKRGIGAVLLALLAAGLLAFLLKDKADQRQDIVDMPLPGSDNTAEAVDGATKLPQLSMDNTSSVNVDGSVIASAGAENATSTTEGVLDSATGKIAASAAAVGAGVAGAVGAVTSAGEKALDFNVRPPSNSDSAEFRDLSDVDLVNNGNSTAAKAADTVKAAAASTAATVASSTSSVKASTSTGTSRPSNTTRGTVIASSGARSSGGQARLIDERQTKAPRSSRTDTVVSSRKASTSTTRASAPKPAPVQKKVVAPTVKAAAPKPKAAPAASNGAGYAIQLLATSSASRAQSLVSVMRKEGYSAYSTKVTQNGKLLYRVRIGQYANKAEATKVHVAMKRRYKKNADVNRSAIVRR